MLPAVVCALLGQQAAAKESKSRATGKAVPAREDFTMSALAASAAAAIGARGILPRACLEAAMAKAEETYQRHVARRRASFNGHEPPLIADVDELIDKLLVPTYPCILEQRTGVGGEGGK